MKCRIDDGCRSCRRCQRAGIPCIFKARANVGACLAGACTFLIFTLPQAVSRHFAETTIGEQRSANPLPQWDQSVLERLRTIETILGIQPPGAGPHEHFPAQDSDVLDEGEVSDPSLRPLWDAVAVLKRIDTTPHNPKIWSRPVIRQLWSS